MDEVAREKLRKRLSQKRKTDTNLRGKPKSLEHKQKLAAHWDHERRLEQAVVARRVNEVENQKLKDYICPDCGEVFERVKKGVYGGHRKACLYWQKVEKWLEQEEVEVLDEILEI